MVVGPRFIIGLDLHGTLLEPGEIIRPELIEPVARGLAKLKGAARRFICTGNDLEFVLRKVPREILQNVDGHVLETGCSTSPDGKAERVLTSDAERAAVSGLEKEIREQGFSEINYFAHRLTTISMFCDDPRGFFEQVRAFVDSTEYRDKVLVTYSSVAVDVLPAGYNKFEGLKKVSEGLATIGVADSMNDAALLADADYAFAPANMAPELKPLLEKKGRAIENLSEATGLRANTVFLASSKETRGVIEILSFLEQVWG